jgi:hypothetical protein
VERIAMRVELPFCGRVVRCVDGRADDGLAAADREARDREADCPCTRPLVTASAATKLKQIPRRRFMAVHPLTRART